MSSLAQEGVFTPLTQENAVGFWTARMSDPLSCMAASQKVEVTFETDHLISRVFLYIVVLYYSADQFGRSQISILLRFRFFFLIKIVVFFLFRDLCHVRCLLRLNFQLLIMHLLYCYLNHEVLNSFTQQYPIMSLCSVLWSDKLLKLYQEVFSLGLHFTVNTYKVCINIWQVSQ